MSNAKQLLIFMGPPGSGKGSLSQLCVKNFGWKQLSTGNLCRKHVQEETELGKRIEFFIKSGNLIDDVLMVDMVQQWLDEAVKLSPSIIFDGFPRNLVQAQELYSILEKKLVFCKLRIFKFLASDNIVLKRLLNRYICANKNCQSIYSVDDFNSEPNQICSSCNFSLIRRSDDESDVIQGRIKHYRAHEEGLIDFYLYKGIKIKEINVERPLDIVFQSFKSIIFG